MSDPSSISWCNTDQTRMAWPRFANASRVTLNKRSAHVAWPPANADMPVSLGLPPMPMRLDLNIRAHYDSASSFI